MRIDVDCSCFLETSTHLQETKLKIVVLLSSFSKLTYSVNLWFNTVPSCLSTPTFACCYYLKHVLLVVVTITWPPRDVFTPRYVINVETVMQSCLPHI
jgi:hypothetical protein